MGWNRGEGELARGELRASGSLPSPFSWLMGGKRWEGREETTSTEVCSVSYTCQHGSFWPHVAPELFTCSWTDDLEREFKSIRFFIPFPSRYNTHDALHTFQGNNVMCFRM